MRVRVIDGQVRIVQRADLQPSHGVDVDGCEDLGVHWRPRSARRAVARHRCSPLVAWRGIFYRPCRYGHHGNRNARHPQAARVPGTDPVRTSASRYRRWGVRILVVSAHYPPDFVSGGTLTPQRLARGLRSRGHDVGVYAGSLDSERAPLSAWSDADETGLPARWVASWPWIGWDDPNCYDNRRITADFAEHVARL